VKYCFFSTVDQHRPARCSCPALEADSRFRTRDDDCQIGVQFHLHGWHSPAEEGPFYYMHGCWSLMLFVSLQCCSTVT